MDLKGLIESLATGWADRLTLLAPLVLIGLVGLYVAYLLIGYLHASQQGIEADAVAGEVLTGDGAAVAALPAGAPYCLVDGLVHPPGAAYCARCEADLARDCATCGTTIRAADGICYSCGTRQ